MTAPRVVPSAWMSASRDRVEARLAHFLGEKRAETERRSPASLELVEAIDGLTMRGGKRLRPMVLEAAYRAVAPTGDPRVCDDAGAALEMLQTYLLIHDDWMDLDEERRGGKSVYASFRDRLGDAHLGAAIAVLAGDLASAFAAELMTHAAVPPKRLREALDAFWAIQREVVWGQHLDMRKSRDINRVYDLKTGSYTVRGPARLGALLGDASGQQLAVLDEFTAPLGIAFQVRDELLGTFGDPSSTGKPRGNDLRAGKHTKIIETAEALLAPKDFAVVRSVLGVADASEDAVGAATELLTRSGVRDSVEKELGLLVESAHATLDRAPFVTDELRAIVALLTHRDR
jgi:geranylgeranyl diphosphate synthase type I